MKRNSVAGDKKGLDPEILAARKKSDGRPQTAETARKREMQKRNAEMRARLKAAKRKGGDAKGLSAEVLEMRKKMKEQSVIRHSKRLLHSGSKRSE